VGNDVGEAARGGSGSVGLAHSFGLPVTQRRVKPMPRCMAAGLVRCSLDEEAASVEHSGRSATA
jgi:hypothetical protein